MRINRKACLLLLVTIGWSLMALGCNGSGGSSIPKHQTSGLLSYRGNPIAGAQVVFYNDELGISRGGLTGDDGRFCIISKVSGDGLPAGEYQVVVRTAPGSDIDLPAAPIKEIAKKYWSRKSTDLVMTITAGKNEIKIDLD